MLNILFSLAFMLISAICLINAQTIPGATEWDIIGSRLFPQMMFGGMGICSAFIFLDSVRAHLKRKAEGKREAAVINRSIMVLFVALLVWVCTITVGSR